jgi:hypothetical protein
MLPIVTALRLHGKKFDAFLAGNSSGGITVFFFLLFFGNVFVSKNGCCNVGDNIFYDGLILQVFA